MKCNLCLALIFTQMFWLLIVFTAFADDTLVYQIDIRKEIGNGLRVYIEKGIKDAELNRAVAIIFDVHTPGGALDAARDIIDVIQRSEIPTIAFVNTEAISAGAMISLACDQIVIRRGGTIGDAAPVSIQGQEAGEKAVSYVRGKISATAERQGRNPDTAAAMVDKKLTLVKYYESGDIVALRPSEYEKELETDKQMKIISAEGELLTLTAERSLEYKLVEAIAENRKQILEMYSIVEVDGKLMVLTQEAIMSKRGELGEEKVKEVTSLTDAEIRRVDPSFADEIVFFVTAPIISSLLLSLGMLGLFIEIRSPGFGLPGLIGVICLSLFFGGHMLSQVEAQYALLAFVLGIGLLVIEAFVIPGFGVAGIAGIGCIIYSVFFIFENAYQTEQAIFFLGVSVLITTALLFVAVYFLPRTRAWQHLVLQTEIGSDKGFHSAVEDYSEHLGQTGVALTALRPAGTAMIENKRLDVVSVGDFIDVDMPVRIVGVEGSKIVVEESRQDKV